ERAMGMVPKPRYWWPPDYSSEEILAATAIALGNENREVLAELIKQDPEDEELQERAKRMSGIPTYLAAVQAVMKLGRFDMIVERYPDGVRFLYAPGRDVFNAKSRP